MATSADSSNGQLPVLIIGAGLGGLTLAHSLRKYNIPYRIFEREDESSQRAQGYRISMSGQGPSGLKAALTPELFSQFEKSTVKTHLPNGRISARTGQVERSGVIGMLGTGGLTMIGALLTRYVTKRPRVWKLSTSQNGPVPVLPDPIDNNYQVDRRVLRGLLSADQGEHLSYDSAFTSYTVNEDSVTAHFANGSSATGCLLVGADGGRSKVATQLVGPQGAAPLDLGVRIIYGKTPLTEQVDSILPEHMKKGTDFVVDWLPDGHRVIVVTECMRFTHENAPQSYVFWAFGIRTELFDMEDDKVLALHGQEAAELVNKFTAEWHPSIKVIFENQAVEETAVLKMSASDPDNPLMWETNRRVTLLGDAMHQMPPTAGNGANTACYDGALLGYVLNNGEKEGNGWSKKTIENFEAGVRYNVGDIIGMAVTGASKLFA